MSGRVTILGATGSIGRSTAAVLRGHRVRLAPGTTPEREQPPVGGFRRVPVILEPR